VGAIFSNLKSKKQKTMSNIISLSDYANSHMDLGGAFGTGNLGDVQELNKALSAGDVTGRDTTGLLTASGAPLKVESLEANLKYLTYKQKDIRFWQLLGKKPAYNTVEEYNQVVTFGTQRGGFIAEGGLPETEDSVYRRLAQHVKFLGVTREVTHPMTLVRTQSAVGDIMRREVSNGIMWLLRKIDGALAFADSNIIPDEFNGVYQQHQAAFNTLDDYFADEVLIDMRGSHITQEVVTDAVDAVIDNNGFVDQLIGPHRVMSDIAKQFLQAPYGTKLIEPNSPQVTNATMGQRVSQITVQNGDVGLNYDKFLTNDPARKSTDISTSTKAPANPGTAAAAVVPTVTGSLFAAADAGDYIYGVAAVNRYGESQVVVDSAVTVAAAGAVDITITDNGGTYPATGFVIYRSKLDDTAGTPKLYPLFRVSTAQLAAGYDGGAAGKVRDKNRFLPDTQQCWLFSNTEDVVEFKQLAPMMKMDLAVLATSFRFMCLLYGTPILYTPKKTVRFINVGRFA
jgi:hypothetical protein